MNTDQLHLFIAIVRHRSLSRAAAELDLGQATASERLKALEAEVGAALFERQGRGMALTPAGEAFRPSAERALDLLRQAGAAARAAHRGLGGQVNVAVTVTSGAYLFAPALMTFQRERPGVEVRVRSAHSADSPGLILDGLAELALISGPYLHPQIESVASFTAPLVLAAGRQNPLAAAPGPLTLEQVARERMLVSFWGAASQNFLAQLRAAADPQAAPWMELSPVELVKGMLLAGSGVSLVPEIAVRRELAAGDLVRLRLAPGSPNLPPWEINLLRRRFQPLNPAAAALVETLKRVLPELIRPAAERD